MILRIIHHDYYDDMFDISNHDDDDIYGINHHVESVQKLFPYDDK